MKVLITGGAGFVGSSLAVGLKARHPSWTIATLDNLKRRGSELALTRLRNAGIEFAHGDVRVLDDLTSLGGFDLMIECSAEPSVLAGLDGNPSYVLQTNLLGTLNCLEAARRCSAAMLFLSTSRIYPMAGLREVKFKEGPTRLLFDQEPSLGLSKEGVSEDFPLNGPRSIYGATKLASELILTEYIDTYGMKGMINRCGVLTGPWQMGKVDQGVVMHWVASHLFNQPLKYIGYGGTGKQVRDILHVEDLFDLVVKQIEQVQSWNGEIYNVGGGHDCSVSLLELTTLSQNAVGNRVEISSDPQTRTADIPWFVTDSSRVKARYGWAPRRTPSDIVTDIAAWMRREQTSLKAALGF